MPGAPDLAHPALAQLLLQAVAPQLAGALDLGAQLVDHAGADIGHAHDEEVGEHQPEEELGRIDPDRGGAGRDHEPDDDGDRADRCQGGQQRPARRGRHDDREQHDPHGDPGEPHACPGGSRVSLGSANSAAAMA